jgi:uncharacterized protein
MAAKHGSPTWIDHSTTDMAASKGFYSELLGWEFEDLGEETAHYHFIRKDGALVGGAMDVSKLNDPDGNPRPAEWQVHLAVDDLDKAFRVALDRHALPVYTPTQSGDFGRFALVKDPTGAEVAMWEAGTVAGSDLRGGVGMPVWFELMTNDYEKAVGFYTEVFRFDETRMPGDFRYATHGSGDAPGSWGLCDARGVVADGTHSYWRIYLEVEDCDVALTRVRELGGRLLDGPMDSPFGRVATVADPVGASFQLLASR